MNRAAVLLALLPSLALGQSAPWLADRCTNKIAKHPQMVDVPPTADNPKGAWLLPDPLVCAVDAELKKTERVTEKVVERKVVEPLTLVVAAVLGIAAGIALGVAAGQK